MPMHDWSRTPGWVWHQLHLGWVLHLSDACNKLLPPRHYSLIEYAAAPPDSTRMFDLPDTAFTGMNEETGAAAKRRTVAVRRASDHRKVAVIEVIGPAIKRVKKAYTTFLAKAAATRELGLGLLVIDPFPPGRFDPGGIPAAIWAATGQTFPHRADRPLTFASFPRDRTVAFTFEALAVGDALPDMQLDCGPECVIKLPLEATYQAAWASFPKPLRPLLEGPPAVE